MRCTDNANGGGETGYRHRCRPEVAFLRSRSPRIVASRCRWLRPPRSSSSSIPVVTDGELESSFSRMPGRWCRSPATFLYLNFGVWRALSGLLRSRPGANGHITVQLLLANWRCPGSRGASKSHLWRPSRRGDACHVR
jgi:hypothetical protein